MVWTCDADGGKKGYLRKCCTQKRRENDQEEDPNQMDGPN